MAVSARSIPATTATRPARPVPSGRSRRTVAALRADTAAIVITSRSSPPSDLSAYRQWVLSPKQRGATARREASDHARAVGVVHALASADRPHLGADYTEVRRMAANM